MKKLDNKNKTYLNYSTEDGKNAQDILQKLLRGIQIFDKEGTQPILLISARMRQAFQKLVSRYICPSVIEITLVGTNADTSPA